MLPFRHGFFTVAVSCFLPRIYGRFVEAGAVLSVLTKPDHNANQCEEDLTTP
jgi:hypothetical protein